MTHNDMTLVERAREFAHAAHDSIGQKRKYGDRPYWVHTDEVANTVRLAGGSTTMQCAAHLHDVLEDVFPKNPVYSLKAIEKEFGVVVAALVVELTDVYTKETCPGQNRAERHALENIRRGRISPEAATIKLADILSNTADISKNDPEFAATYLEEISAVLPLLCHGNAMLWQAAYEQVQQCAAWLQPYYQSLSQKSPALNPLVTEQEGYPIGERGQGLGHCCGNGCIDCTYWSRPQVQVKGGRLV